MSQKGLGNRRQLRVAAKQDNEGHQRRDFKKERKVMSTIVVMGDIASQPDGSTMISKSSLCAIQAAGEFAAATGGGAVHLLLIGQGAHSAAARLSGSTVAKVHWYDAPAVARYRGPTYASVVVAAMKQIGADTLFCGASSTGKDLAPCVAALLDAGQASDIIGVNPDGTLRRPMYAGDVIADVEITTAAKVVTVRASAFAPAPTSGGAALVEELLSVGELPERGEVVGYELSASERPELSSAAVVVSGGRAVGSAENFEKVIYPLADVLGAAVGASRAAVDSGYAPNDWQVGQTGKVVAPQLYVAVGISGAIQHLAGMKDSKVIVAINKDPEAPIFEVATYGLVADLFEATPALTTAIQGVKG